MTMEFHSSATGQVFEGAVDGEKLVKVLNAVGMLKKAVETGMDSRAEPDSPEWLEHRDNFSRLCAELFVYYDELVDHLMETGQPTGKGVTND